MQTATAGEGYSSKSEDRVVILQQANTVILAVADGAGGLSGGAEAAEVALELLVHRVSQPDWLPQPVECVAALREMDRTIWQRESAGQTTVVIAMVTDCYVFGASVGDSGAWLIDTPGMIDLTHGQRRKPLCGSGSAIPVGFGPTLFMGTLLVATDGLFKYARRTEIQRVATGSDLAYAARSLIDLVRLPNGELQDDVALGLCRL